MSRSSTTGGRGSGARPPGRSLVGSFLASLGRLPPGWRTFLRGIATRGARVVENVRSLKPDEPAVAARQRKRLGSAVYRDAVGDVSERDELVPTFPVLAGAEGTLQTGTAAIEKRKDRTLRAHRATPRTDADFAWARQQPLGRPRTVARAELATTVFTIGATHGGDDDRRTTPRVLRLPARTPRRTPRRRSRSIGALGIRGT